MTETIRLYTPFYVITASMLNRPCINNRCDPQYLLLTTHLSSILLCLFAISPLAVPFRIYLARKGTKLLLADSLARDQTQ